MRPLPLGGLKEETEFFLSLYMSRSTHIQLDLKPIYRSYKMSFSVDLQIHEVETLILTNISLNGSVSESNKSPSDTIISSSPSRNSHRLRVFVLTFSFETISGRSTFKVPKMVLTGHKLYDGSLCQCKARLLNPRSPFPLSSKKFVDHRA